MNPQIQVTDAVNQLAARAAEKDADYQALIDKILNLFDCLSEDISASDKYKKVLESEYLFLKLRTSVEFESVTIKRLLNDNTILPVLKAFFTKRDVYLAALSMKLTTIRDDINILQRIQYTISTNQIK